MGSIDRRGRRGVRRPPARSADNGEGAPTLQPRNSLTATLEIEGLDGVDISALKPVSVKGTIMRTTGCWSMCSRTDQGASGWYFEESSDDDFIEGYF